MIAEENGSINYVKLVRIMFFLGGNGEGGAEDKIVAEQLQSKILVLPLLG